MLKQNNESIQCLVPVSNAHADRVMKRVRVRKQLVSRLLGHSLVCFGTTRRQRRACGAYDQKYAATLTSAYVPAADISGASNGKRRRAADGANWIMGKMERLRIGLDVAGALLGMFEVRNESM